MEKSRSALAIARGDRPQDEIAGQLGVTQATVSHWETGTFVPSSKLWKRIARAYKMPYANLVAYFGRVAA